MDSNVALLDLRKTRAWHRQKPSVLPETTKEARRQVGDVVPSEGAFMVQHVVASSILHPLFSQEVMTSPHSHIGIAVVVETGVELGVSDMPQNLAIVRPDQSAQTPFHVLSVYASDGVRQKAPEAHAHLLCSCDGDEQVGSTLAQSVIALHRVEDPARAPGAHPAATGRRDWLCWHAGKHPPHGLVWPGHSVAVAFMACHVRHLRAANTHVLVRMSFLQPEEETRFRFFMLYLQQSSAVKIHQSVLAMCITCKAQRQQQQMACKNEEKHVSVSWSAPKAP
mmetsp:Transcript_31503/g.55812  ORF Transcript_31503/g.55812 Transcript_31503/m.55812 type:complete len:280 (-) Transcript_31503:3-842(-)